ncbi:MAG: hypothetical protein VX278_14610, partial [Myxococcota bacterium]|nr:hypothetical protein [Myxococcota bacterium]
MGGLSRRASVIAETPKPRLVVEGGNWAWKSSYIKDSQVPQQKLKAELQLHAFQRSGIDAIGIGASDLVLGLDWFQERTEDHPFIATNMQCGERYPFQRYQVTEKAGLQLGVVSLISQKAKIDGCSIESPSDAVEAVLKDQKDVDLWIVLSGLPEKENQAL